MLKFAVVAIGRRARDTANLAKAGGIQDVLDALANVQLAFLVLQGDFFGAAHFASSALALAERGYFWVPSLLSQAGPLGIFIHGVQ
jgi:hypothetical protein